MECPPDAAAEGNRRSLRTPAVGRLTRLPTEDVPGLAGGLPSPGRAGSLPARWEDRPAHGLRARGRDPPLFWYARGGGKFCPKKGAGNLKRCLPARRRGHFTGSRVERGVMRQTFLSWPVTSALSSGLNATQ